MANIKQYACVAEACADLYSEGYETVKNSDTLRIMESDTGAQVTVEHLGLLDVIVRDTTELDHDICNTYRR
jgi:hypothetical protein